MAELCVYTFAPRDHTASFFYRLLAPLRAMSDLGLPIKMFLDTDSNRVTPLDRVRAFCESDLCLMYQPVGDMPLNNVRQVQSFIPTKRDGKWKYPPSIVIESDDNLFHVSPLNPAFRNLGFRDPSGHEIPLGNHIGLVQNGERVVRWIDGHTCDGTCGPNGRGDCNLGINLGANRLAVEGYRKILAACDALTCSTEEIAQAYLREVPLRRHKVFPNMVRFDDYEQVDLAAHPNEVRILWQGGQNHYEDWYPLRKALGNVTRKYPQVHWVIWGALYSWVMNEIPAERYTFKNWAPYQEYKLRLAMIGHDINLAPLSVSPFNVCRSAIKFYESSVLRRPAATLAQNTGPYAREIIDGDTGLLFDTPEEFEDKLSLLIESELERISLARNAKDWLSQNRDLMKRAPEIFEYWSMLREEKKLDQPLPSEAEWQELEQKFNDEQQAAAAEGNGRELAAVRG